MVTKSLEVLPHVYYVGPELTSGTHEEPLWGLEVTLRNLLFERWDQVPALRMIHMDASHVRIRAEALLPRLEGLHASIVEGSSVIGGGSTPQQALPTYLIAIEYDQVAALERRLREGNPPVVARIENEKLLLDLRTVLPEEEPLLINALLTAAT